MPDEQSDNDLFSSSEAGSAPVAQPESLKAKFEALVHAYFPDLDSGGFEAHQPLRDFLLDLHALLP